MAVGGTYAMQNNPTAHGFDNLEVGLKYLLYVNEAHEFMTSVGVNAELGGTGSHAIADRFSTISPTIFAGKGFGDLPDSLAYLRPIAITGEAGPALTTGAGQPNAFNCGFTFQYSLPYLQQHVRDIGLPQPLANIIPLVEIPLSRSRGQTTGTVNPGFIWINRYGQFGVEAQIDSDQPRKRLARGHSGPGSHFLRQRRADDDRQAPVPVKELTMSEQSAIRRRAKAGGALLLAGLVFASAAFAHVFPRKQEPGAGATVVSPATVKITFEGPLEPAFSSLTVTDAGGKQMNTAKAVVDAHEPTVMTVPLPTLSTGHYIVHWVAVASDGHRTHGDYAFDVQ